jgi:UTP:GlnB (protein PII) uridylyltransferase
VVVAYTKASLRERLKNKIMASSKGGNPGQWSARKAQLLANEYKKAGGGYSGSKTTKQKSLSKWTKQKWTTSDGKPSEGKKRYLPKKAWSALSSSEKKATNAAKAKGNKQGKQFVAQPKKVAKKVKKYRT